MLPNFMIVGAPKAGTTSLYHYLSEHPEVFMSDPKEVNFFSAEEIKEQGLYYKSFSVQSLEAYESLFSNAKDKRAIGEGSVSYLFYSNTAAKIKKVLPEVKIIILLRNPVERAFSHYLMDYRMGLVNVPFEDVVYQRSNHKQSRLFYQQFVGLGMYYEQVKRYTDLFGEAQVKVYLQEDLRDGAFGIVQSLYRFLGVSSDFIPNLDRSHNAFSMPKGKLIHKIYSSSFVRSIAQYVFRDSIKESIKNIFFERTKKPALNSDTKKYLKNLYRTDIDKLESIIQRDLSAWKEI